MCIIPIHELHFIINHDLVPHAGWCLQATNLHAAPYIYVLIEAFEALVLGLPHRTVQLANKLTAKDMC